MRLIDAEEIEELFYKQVEYGATDLFDAFDDALLDARTVDAAEVLRDQWISVEDRLPEGFRPVIVCREKVKGEYVVEQGYKDVGDWWKVYGTRTKNVTHWMPLPEPPDKPC